MLFVYQYFTTKSLEVLNNNRGLQLKELQALDPIYYGIPRETQNTKTKINKIEGSILES